jgi:hypothetical protein
MRGSLSNGPNSEFQTLDYQRVFSRVLITLDDMYSTGTKDGQIGQPFYSGRTQYGKCV